MSRAINWCLNGIYVAVVAFGVCLAFLGWHPATKASLVVAAVSAVALFSVILFNLAGDIIAHFKRPTNKDARRD